MVLVLLLLQSLIVPFCQCCPKCEIVSLKTNGTVIIGRKLRTVYGNNTYGAFWKIPYAKPPVGRLRFKLAQEQCQWLSSDTYDFTVMYNESCACGLDEDCLYLSVYMPLINLRNCIYPVLVWIYDHSYSHGPDFFIDEGVMVVTVSFRSWVLGFLNTGDDFANGNMGAKDILTALKWIRNNIKLFNGDANKVTVAGSGNSANIVASFLVSPAAEDLFSKIIIQSGSALSPANYRNYIFETLSKLYWNLNGPFEKFNRQKLYNILQNSSTAELLSASRNLFDSTEIRDTQRLINPFGLSIESSKPTFFMNEHPVQRYKKNMCNNKVEVLMGYNNFENLYKLKGLSKNKRVLNYLNHNFQYLVPFEGKSDEYESKTYKKIRERIKDFFFVNGTISQRSLRRYSKYLSDQIIYPLLRQAKLHAEVSGNDVYLYRFSFKGSLNVGWHSSVGNLNFSGATLGDEICYMFRCAFQKNNYNASVLTTEKKLIRKITRLWTNFIKYGNPIPNTNDVILDNLKWLPLTPNHKLKALHIGKNMKFKNVSEEERMLFWDNLREEYFDHNSIIEQN